MASHCSAVLAVQPTNLKALLRRAEARARLGESGGAASDCHAVLRVEPHNSVGARETPIDKPAS